MNLSTTLHDKVILFSKLLNFEGRNGYFKCLGIGIDSFQDDRIAIYPITSKNLPGRCEIQVEKDKIPELIKQLQKVIQ